MWLAKPLQIITSRERLEPMVRVLVFLLFCASSSLLFAELSGYSGKQHNYQSKSINTLGVRGDFDVLTPPKIVLMKPGGLDIDVRIVGSGSPVAKYSCPAGKTLGVFASVITMCDNGLSNIISGQHITAIDGGATITPQLWIFTNRGSGGAWNLVNSSCGRLEIRQVCQ